MMPKAYKKLIIVVSVLLMALSALPALAKMPREDVKRLKDDLTPFGAERAGNAEGTIPEWKGGLTNIPRNVSFDPALGTLSTIYPSYDSFRGG